MSEVKSIFERLNNVDVSKKMKTKNNLQYLPWCSAWAEVKKIDPNASFRIIPQVMDEGGNTRFWHDDGRTGWVEVGVTVNDQEIVEVLAIMDFKNKSMPADQITSVDANKSMKRCLVKAIAMHGLGLYIYEGEETPEEMSKVEELLEEVRNIMNKKCALSDKAKEKVKDLCRNAEKKANPHMEDELILGNPANIDSSDILEDLKKQLLAVRK